MPTHVPWSTFNTVVTALFVGLLGLVGIIYYDMRGDIEALNSTAKGIATSVTDGRVEMLKEVSGIREEAARTNARLDLVVDALQRRR